MERKPIDITCLSDCHGFFPSDLPGGDLLIVAGDLTARDTEKQQIEFFKWLEKQEYKRKIVIAGNHDNFLYKLNGIPTGALDIEYLCDSGTTFENLRIWGSPWTKTFERMNPKCKAFTCDTEEELAEKWAKIPDDIDILITHGPPYGILDKVEIPGVFNLCYPAEQRYESVGSKSLALKIGKMEKPPKIWCWGHIHEAYGEDLVIRQKPCKMINCSHVNERYHPVNKPVRVIL